MTKPAKSIHGEWSSRWAFVLAATGSAVGLGNIWKFPYITGENGGGAFVLVYLLCVIGLGLPLMIAEIMLGRRGRQNPVNTMQSLAEESASIPAWSWLGLMGVAAGFIILSYYSVIAGQALAYIPFTFSGLFSGASAELTQQVHADLSLSPGRLIFWHSLFMLMTIFIVSRGVNKGLESSVRLMMPALFAILLVLIVYAMTTGEHFISSLNFLFSPDFSKLSQSSVLTALGHAFFTLSLGMGAIMVYGSYLPKDTSILRVSIYISVLDTVVALLAGIAVFTLVFANNMQAGAGPGLIFETLPIAFGNMPGGQIFGGLFFVLLVFAAWSSAISLIEPSVTWLVENKGMSRLTATISSGLAIWLLGLLTVFSFNIGESWTLFNMTAFELLDFLTANIMLPVGGFLIAIFAGWIMNKQTTENELSMTSRTTYQAWYTIIRFVTPVAIFIVFANLVGLIG